MSVKLFKPKTDSISLFNKSGIAIKDIKNIEGTDGLLVTYKDGSQEIFENYKYLINYDGVKETYDPTIFESINVLEDSNDINVGDIIYYNGDFIIVDQEFIDNLVANALVNYYKFEGNAKDEIGNFDGIWSGTEQYQDGYDGLAAYFDGESYIQISDEDQPSYIDNYIELELMIYWINNDVEEQIFNLGVYTAEAKVTTSGEIYIAVGDGWGWHETSIYLEEKTWTKLKFTYDKNSGDFNVYVNDELKYSFNNPSSYSFSKMCIGYRLDGSTTNKFTGMMDEVKIYSNIPIIKKLVL